MGTGPVESALLELEYLVFLPFQYVKIIGYKYLLLKKEKLGGFKLSVLWASLLSKEKKRLLTLIKDTNYYKC